jgi:hypothetical protein
MYGCTLSGSRHDGWYVTDPEGKVHGSFGTKESAKRWIRSSYGPQA